MVDLNETYELIQVAFQIRSLDDAKVWFSWLPGWMQAVVVVLIIGFIGALLTFISGILRDNYN